MTDLSQVLTVGGYYFAEEPPPYLETLPDGVPPDDMVLGSEQFTDTGFDTGIGWSVSTGWSIGGGTANCDGSQTNISSVYQQNAGMLGALGPWQVQFTLLNYSAGSISVRLGTATNVYSASFSANGTYTVYVDNPNIANNFVGFTADADFIGSVDNVSCKQVVSGYAGGARTRACEGGVESAGLHIVGAEFENICTYANDLSGSGWAGVGITPVDQGDTWWKVEDDNNAGLEQYGYNAAAITADSLDYCFAIDVKKDDTSHDWIVFKAFLHTSQFQQELRFNIDTGAYTTWGLGTLKGTFVEEYDDRWRLHLILTNDGTRVQPGIDIYPAYWDGTGVDTTLTGHQFVRNALIAQASQPIPFIPTDGATAKMAAETCKVTMSTAFKGMLDNLTGDGNGTFVVDIDNTYGSPPVANEGILATRANAVSICYWSHPEYVNMYDVEAAVSRRDTNSFPGAIRFAGRWSQTIKQIGFRDSGGTWYWSSEGSHDGKFNFVDTYLEILRGSTHPRHIKNLWWFDTTKSRAEIEALGF